MGSGASCGMMRGEEKYEDSEGKCTAACYFDGLAGDPARFWAGEKRHHIGDVIWLANALQGLLAEGKGFAVS